MNRYCYVNNYLRPATFFEGQVFKYIKNPSHTVEIVRNIKPNSSHVRYWHTRLKDKQFIMTDGIDRFRAKYEPA